MLQPQRQHEGEDEPAPGDAGEPVEERSAARPNASICRPRSIATGGIGHKVAASMILAPMLLAAALAGGYLAWDPPSADLAAQTFRADLFSELGFSVWSNAWYAGIHLPGYSLLFPPLASWLSPQLVGAISAVASAGLFGAIAHRRCGGACPARGHVVRGRDQRQPAERQADVRARAGVRPGRPAGAPARAPGSRRRTGRPDGAGEPDGGPVPGARRRRGRDRPPAGRRRQAGVGLRARGRPGGRRDDRGARDRVPDRGVEPFVSSAFWAVPAFCVIALVLLPGDERVLRWGVGLYALADDRALPDRQRGRGQRDPPRRAVRRPGDGPRAAGRRPVALALVALPLLAWQIAPGCPRRLRRRRRPIGRAGLPRAAVERAGLGGLRHAHPRPRGAHPQPLGGRLRRRPVSARPRLAAPGRVRRLRALRGRQPHPRGLPPNGSRSTPSPTWPSPRASTSTTSARTRPS